MKKIRTLSILVGLLVVINLGLVLWLFKPPVSPRNAAEAEARIQQIFQFDEGQMQLARTSRDKHKANLAERMDALDELSIDYYTSTDTAYKSALLRQLLEATETIYAINDRHFEEIREICHEDQRQHVQGLIRSLILRER
ncbi:MAG: hypothetical protein AAFY91_09495 [Bacteroidota bacterium]